MPSPVDAGENIVNGIVAVGGMNDAKSSYEFVVAAEQAVAFFAAVALNPTTAGAAIATNAMAASGVIGKMLTDINEKGKVDFGDVVSLAGNVAVIATAIVVSGNPTSRAMQVAIAISRGIGWIGVGSYFVGKASAAEIDDSANTNFNNSRAWVQRSDPLTLDLDGDGLETVGIDTVNPILFDHDGDGVKNATGWIKPDDGFLVLDRNGDGVINDGSELFGDSTPVFDADGNVVRKAVDGFDALAQQDSNGDGLVNNQDANWASLRVWQDANSDGISQASELKSLQELGIAALRVAKTDNNSAIGNGNVLADLGSFIYTDGHEASLGEVTGGMADIDLADNPFYREYTDQLDTSAVADLPDMQGSGAVRDLREASTLSEGLASVLQSYASATTKAEQTALLGEVLNQWAETGDSAGGFDTSVELAQEQGFTLSYRAPNGADVTEWVELLEIFNGMPFVQVGAGGRAHWRGRVGSRHQRAHWRRRRHRANAHLQPVVGADELSGAGLRRPQTVRLRRAAAADTTQTLPGRGGIECVCSRCGHGVQRCD